jgi:hypothetical protein
MNKNYDSRHFEFVSTVRFFLKPRYLIRPRLFIYLNFILLMWRIGRAPNRIPIYSKFNDTVALNVSYSEGIIAVWP